MTIHWAVTDPASTMRWSSTSSSRSWSTGPATSGSPMLAARPRRCAGAATSGSAWAVWDRLRLACLDAYDHMIGLDLTDLAVDGCTTKAVCGGECAGRSPVDRGKGGVTRSQ